MERLSSGWKLPCGCAHSRQGAAELGFDVSAETMKEVSRGEPHSRLGAHDPNTQGLTEGYRLVKTWQNGLRGFWEVCGD